MRHCGSVWLWLLFRRRQRAPQRRDEVLTLLRENCEALRTSFGVRSISLFGSHARDEARPDSYVDLLVEFEDVT